MKRPVDKSKKRKAGPPPRVKKTAQSKAFVATARELGCSDDPEAFNQALRKIAPPKRIKLA